uniref:Nudix hydrolase domain-containing protein n=1 Tax=viral metagenome TaxID=1070528 RepID=A0A6C0I3K7_9ZZZZ
MLYIQDYRMSYCNNCGKNGHTYHQCKIPITSLGIVAVRENTVTNQLEYLMIRRKDTLGFIDFMRGKYSVYNKGYIMNMIKQMTMEEKEKLKSLEFYQLWESIWGTESISGKYKSEEAVSRDKIILLQKGVLVQNDFYTLSMLIDESNKEEACQWNEPEWGFPKGRRNFQEKDYDCALREFTEETGCKTSSIYNINNILPFEEIFTGSNYKSYKHKYFVGMMNYSDSDLYDTYERTEVSKMAWKTYEQCMECIRSYNIEKKNVVTAIHTTLSKYGLFRI